MKADQLKSSAIQTLSSLDSTLSEIESALEADPTNREMLRTLTEVEKLAANLTIERNIVSLSPKQFEAFSAFHSREYRLIGCCGANRAGKTMGGGTAYAQYLRDEAPRDSEHICVTTEQRLSRKNQQKFLWESIPHAMFDVEWSGPKNGFGSVNPVVVIDKRTATNPNGRNVTVNFMTQSEFDNNRDAFEGLTIETAWIDEAVSHELFSAVSARCVMSDDGRILVTAIPNADWVYDLIYNAKPSSRVWFKLFEPFDNPLMTPEKWADFESRVPPHERDVRLKGIPAIAGAIVFTEFDRRHHVISRADVPDDVVWYAGLDVGSDHPTVWLLVAVDKQGRLYVVDEYVARNTTVESDVAEIKALLGARALKQATVIDPAAFQVTKANQVCVALQYVRAGLPVRMALRTATYGERAMVYQIKEMFAHDEIFVCDTCPELIRELSVWKYRRDQQNRPIATGGSPFEDRNNDAIDALRYLISMSPRYERGMSTVISDD